jgi:nitrite reductase (NAD(P)H)
LLGVEVASFGDFFADRDGPKELPVGRHGAGAKKEETINSKDRVNKITDGPPPPPVKALSYKDPFQAVYKKYLFTMDGKYILGGMMIGDTKDCQTRPNGQEQETARGPASAIHIGCC